MSDGHPKAAAGTARKAFPCPWVLSRTPAGGHTRRAFGAFLMMLFLFPAFAPAQQAAKTIEGKVLDAGTAPLAGSIVYLQDQKTNVIKTLIATADGGYRFGELPADTDYKVWAEYKGKKSKVRLISSFDTKMDVTYDFHINQ